MATNEQNRKALEARFIDRAEKFDPSGRNTERIIEFFKSLSYEEFIRRMYEYFHNPNQFQPIAYLPYDNPVSLDFCYNMAKKYNVPIEETVYQPYLNEDTEDPPGSVNKLTVIDCVVRRLKQTSNNKNHTSLSSEHRDARTNQITGEDKTARISMPELYSLTAGSMYNVGREYYGPMGDDIEAWNAMCRNIQRDGFVSLEDLPNNPESKMTSDVIAAKMYASGLMSNLVSPDGITLPITIAGREELANGTGTI